MNKLLIIAVFVLVAIVSVTLYLRSPKLVANGPDRNVPGATTGQGRNSLLSP
jgi:hypothetical protein